MQSAKNPSERMSRLLVCRLALARETDAAAKADAAWIHSVAASNPDELLILALAEQDGIDLDDTLLSGLSARATVLVRGPSASSDALIRPYAKRREATGGDAYWWSLLAADVVKGILRDEPSIVYVEFPLHSGLAFAFLQDRLVGRAPDCQVGIRFSSSLLLTSLDAAVPLSQGDFFLCDMERKCLLDCDVIHSAIDPWALATALREYEIPVERVRSKIHHSISAMPQPELVPAPPAAAEVIQLWPDTDRQLIQMVRATLAFLDGNAGGEWQGDVHVDARWFDRLSRLCPFIPATQKPRFVKGCAVHQGLMAVHVSMRAWEGFPTRGHAGTQAGGRLVVDERNPAYSGHFGWNNGSNVFTFSGGAVGLMHAIGGAVLSSNRTAPPLLAWSLPVLQPGRNVTDMKEDYGEPLVSVVVPHYNLSEFLPQTIASVFASSYRNLEVIVVDDASTSGDIAKAMEPFMGDTRVRLIKLESNQGLGGARNAGVALSHGSYILPLDADDVIGSDFIRTAVSALERNPGHDFVVPNAVYFHDGQVPLKDESPRGFCMEFVGEAMWSGFLTNTYSTATSMMRRSIFETMNYREDLMAYEDWDFYQQAFASGRRFIVLCSIMFHYRVRKDSMVHSAESRGRHAEYVNAMSMRLHPLAGASANAAMRVVYGVAGNASQNGPGSMIQDLQRDYIELAQYRNNLMARTALRGGRVLERLWRLLRNADGDSSSALIK